MQFTNQFDHPGFWEGLDMFGIHVNIRFCKQISHKTKVGGFFSIFIYALLFVQIFLIYQNLVDSSNPAVLFQQTFTKSPERFDITPQTFSLAFGLQDPNSQHYFDPSIYQLTLWLKKTQRIFNPQTNDYTTQWHNRIVQLEQCTQNHFQIEQAKAYFLSLKFNSLYCISLQEKDIYIEGEFDANQYSGLEILVNSCIPGSKSPDGKDIICSSDVVINSKLNNGRLAVYYVDNAVVTRDKNNPFQPQGRQSFWVSGPQFSKSLNISFRNSYLYTDLGLITTQIETQRALTFSFDREQTTPKNSNLLFDCYISFEKNMNSEYHRSYPKLDKALSQLGGIYNLLFAIGCLLIKPVSLIEFNRKLINSLFSFEDNTQNSQNISKQKQEENNNLSQIKQSNFLPQITNSEIRDPYLEQNQLSVYQKNNFELKPTSYLKESTTQFNEGSNKSKGMIDSQKKGAINALKNITRNQYRSLTKKQQQNEDSSPKISELKIENNLQIPSSRNKKLSFSLSGLKQRGSQLQSQKESDEQRLKKEAKELESIFVSTFNSIRFKSWEYFVSYFNIFPCWRSKKQDVIQEGVEKLYNHIDVFYIINKLIEVEKLKQLLLNENQLKLFEFIPKPILSTNSSFNNPNSNNQKVGILYEDKRSVLDKTLDAQKAFNNICQNSHKMSTKDKRLIELLHPNCKHLFEDPIDSETDLVEESQNLFYKHEVRKTMLTHPCNKSEDVSIDSRM